ncbi:multicopper oxidase family protein [Kutzneria kofuensis]|uniref:Multicopper oxidase CueO n=1 Tax=Kutzneria kofuensis TaxID=103725 RepID=A0A7W9KLI4_9PSEU|nr:multicopper oxidase domain-containing protein [Kutzneria kofuensis]MBB5894764.1 FtsP/CotA-like multicopper oxidase with cupredoxin domain [Kutzneria kofuensis]
MNDPVDRRSFLTTAVLGSAGVVAGASLLAPPAAAAPTPATPDFGLTKFLDPLRIPPVLRPHARRQDQITVTMKNARIKLHSQLPATEMWTYEGHFPGPTIEVCSGRRLRVAWTNDLDGKIPLTAVKVPFRKPSPANVPGYRNPDGSLPAGVELIDGAADLPPWTVVHVHGAVTNAGSDGWTHNAMLPGNSQLAEYPNRQAASPLWYHDHAMAITRFSVYAGLCGMFLVRDEEEDRLGLPSGDHEVPLVISDRNLDTDGSGALTGKLLYKMPYAPATGTMVPVTGPFTLVNGVIWPHLDVQARWYRFRVLNAANSQFFRLDLVDEAGVVPNDAVRIIGTDGGLLPAPAEVPAGGVTLTPAERIDLLIDFSRFQGRRLRLTSTGSVVEPDIMEFRVENRSRRDPFRLPQRLSKSYVRLVHGTTVPEEHEHVFVAMLPPNVAGEPNPTMWELREITDPPAQFPANGIIQLTDPNTGKVRTFRRGAALFDDTTSFFFHRGQWVVWNFLQLGSAPHPMHIHAARFQLLSRRTWTDLSAFDLATGGTSRPMPVPTEGPVIEKWEQGWKDTFQARQGEWLTVAGRFDGATGEFMYHCHILEHEDMGMMRPFVVHPPEVARVMGTGGSGHHM